MKLTAPRRIHLIVALWLRFSFIACSLRKNSAKLKTHSNQVSELGASSMMHRPTRASSMMHRPTSANNDPTFENLFEEIKPGSDCIKDGKPYDWNSFTLCCEGLRPCEQVYGDFYKYTRFFVCLKNCVPNYFRGQDSSTVRTLVGPENVDVYKDLQLIRYLSHYDETTYEELSAVKPKIKVLSIRPYDYSKTLRFASPFEHICGGNAVSESKADGNDGPSQFISFINKAARSTREAQECTLPFDKGQRRVKTGSKDVLDNGGIVIDLSNEYKAFKWCYEGGCVHAGKAKHPSAKHTQWCFDGARTANPWPFACATRAFQVKRRRSYGTVPDEWWTEENRIRIARSCATWAVRAAEVLLLPNPKTFITKTGMRITKHLKGQSTKIAVVTDRHPATEQCNHSNNGDHCTFYNEETRTVCCSKTSMDNCGLKRDLSDQLQEPETVSVVSDEEDEEPRVSNSQGTFDISQEPEAETVELEDEPEFNVSNSEEAEEMPQKPKLVVGHSDVEQRPTSRLLTPSFWGRFAQKPKTRQTRKEEPEAVTTKSDEEQEAVVSNREEASEISDEPEAETVQSDEEQEPILYNPDGASEISHELEAVTVQSDEEQGPIVSDSEGESDISQELETAGAQFDEEELPILLNSELDYRKVRQSSKSDIRRFVESEQLALEQFQLIINSRWANVQKERDAVNEDWKKAKAQVQASREAYKAEIENINFLRAGRNRKREEISTLKKNIYDKNTRDTVSSEAWQTVKAMESDLKQLGASINSKWAKVQAERTRVEETWKTQTSSINERRKIYQAEIEEIKAKRTIANDHRRQIRELRGIIYKK